jgi:ferredoxin-type protein NapG
MSDDKPIDRRRFFREGLRGLFENVGRVAGPLQRVMKELEGLQGNPAPAPVVPPAPKARKSLGDRILRPPGAKDEDDFINTCSTCGNCVAACPVQCIQIDPDRAGGVPFIIAENTACALCDGLNCMYSCPTGAIVAVPIGLIDMGTGEWNAERCIRSDGTDCTMCVDRCPIGNRAIELIDGRIVVHENGCTGCGVCEHDCPTSPKSIVVIPRAMR